MEQKRKRGRPRLGDPTIFMRIPLALQAKVVKLKKQHRKNILKKVS